MVLDRLQNLVEMNIDIGDINLFNYSNIEIEHKEGDEPLSISDERAIINLAPLDDETQEEILDIYTGENYESEGELLEGDVNTESQSIEEEFNHNRVQETLDFFDDRIADNHLRMVEAALLLREATEAGRDFESRKQDIYEKFGVLGVNVNNLCQSGYFDEGGYIRELCHEIEGAEDAHPDRFREVFEEIIQNTPFTVFVNTHQSVHNVQTEILDRLKRQQKYAVEYEFVDVRGIGANNRRTIQKAIENLKSQYEELEWQKDVSEGEIRVRVDSDTIPDITD